MKKETLLTGIQVTNKLHLGNLFGAIINFRELQNKYNTFIFVADLHSLTPREYDYKNM
jgi:tryptophanyl-tRNA synthetase